MRRLIGGLVAWSLGALLLVAAPPREASAQQAGDPAPDTQAAVEAIKRGRYEDAITSCRRALERDERYVPALMALAKSYYYLKKYELATAIIELAQKLDPNNAEGYHLMGFIALTRSDSISATAAFKKAVELKPDYGNAWNNLAAQYLLAKNYDAATEAAEKAAQLLPTFDKVQLNLGSAYRGKGQYAEAERAYRKALDLTSAYAEAYFNLGILYLDAPVGKIGGEMDLQTKLNTAIGHLSRYKNLASYKLRDNDPTDGYIEEARKGIEREQKRLQRLEKQKERDRAKAPAAPPPSDQAPPPAASPPPADSPPPVQTQPGAPGYEGPPPSAPPPATGGQ